MEFRPLVADDLDLMHRWLNEPGVVRWWEGDDVTWTGIVDDYHPESWGPDVDGYEHFLAVVDGAEIGWIQCGAVAKFEPQHAAPWLERGISTTAAGIDYLIGEPSARGKGNGTAMISAFVDQIVFGLHPAWTEVAADPISANIASCRALAKAGFELVAMIEHEGHADGPSSLMRRYRTSSTPHELTPSA